MRKYGESKTTRIMMATVPHVTSGLGLRKFQADGFLLARVYKGCLKGVVCIHQKQKTKEKKRKEKGELCFNLNDHLWFDFPSALAAMDLLTYYQ